MALELGLPEVVRRIRYHSSLPIIYDHQKAGNDIPEMDKTFAEVCCRADVDAVILFPFSSPVTEERWIKAAQDTGLIVLVGGHMTVPKFLASQDGFIANNAPDRIYSIAAENGVRDFVVPGNKPEYVDQYRALLTGILGLDNFTLYAPGFITQGGNIAEAGKVAGKKWHAIVGSAIYGKDKPFSVEEMEAAAEEVTAQIK